jgi:DNA-binding transcriptional ArsR family regulator
VELLPRKGKRPEWEKEENRKKIFLALLKEPLNFEKLREKLQISRGTLAKHLRELEEKRIIEKARINGKRVYQIAFDNEERILDELKSTHFDLLLKALAELVDPLFIDFWKSYSQTLLKTIIFLKKRELMDKPRISAKELHIKVYENIQSSASPKAKKLMHVDEILDGFKKMPYSAFEELDKFFRSSDKGLQGGKKE